MKKENRTFFFEYVQIVYCVNIQMEIAKNVQNAYIIYKQSNDNIIIVSKYE